MIGFFFHETPYAILFEIAVGAWIWYSPTMRCRLFFSLSFIIIIIIITIIIITIIIIIIITRIECDFRIGGTVYICQVPVVNQSKVN